MNFEDYTPGQLGRIFGAMCQKNHYEVAAEAQAKLLLGFQWLYDRRDEHFGNGRLVRNTFERAIRRLANRIAGIPKLTKALLTTFEADDIDMRDVPVSQWERLSSDDLTFTICCPQCENASRVRVNYLGRRVICNKCEHRFVSSWGEPRNGVSGKGV